MTENNYDIHEIDITPEMAAELAIAAIWTNIPINELLKNYKRACLNPCQIITGMASAAIESGKIRI